MNVLMVSDVYFPRINGVSSSIADTAQVLRRFGANVKLIAPAYEGQEADDEIYRVPGRVVPCDPEDRIMNWRDLRQRVDEVAAWCDVVHVHTPFWAHYAGLRASRRQGVPLVSTYHTLFEEYFPHYLPGLPRPLLRTVARWASRRQCLQADSVIVPSQAMVDRLVEYGVRADVLRILPSGIAAHDFAQGDRQGFRSRHGIDPDRPMALYVGRVAQEKNISFLLHMLRHAHHREPGLLLGIVGDGPDMARLQQEIEALGLVDAVRCFGYLDRQHELVDAYAAADVFVFSSRTETQGLVVLEAMAAGLSVIALAEMGVRDLLVAAPEGCATPPDDPKAFGNAVADFFAAKAQWPRWRTLAANHAHGWTSDVTAHALLALYAQLRERRCRSGP
jgi:1,2-diacylglycerol 3-alpha-glucosyltransferase